MNDVLFYGDSIYFTFFSASGNWKNGIFDGGLGQININNFKIKFLTNDSIQPHSPRSINGSIAFCDSSNAKVILGGQQKELEFYGFVRGLYKFKNYIFVGQSETMYLTRLERLNKLINISSVIYIVDVSDKCKRFIPTNGICNLHDLIVHELK